MAEPVGLFAEQEALADLERALASVLRPGDTELVLTASALASTSGGRLRAMNPEGTHESPEGRFNSASMPVKAMVALDKLRAASYREQVGTWYSVRVTLTAAGSMKAEYDYDNEPVWDAPVDPVAYVHGVLIKAFLSERRRRSSTELPVAEPGLLGGPDRTHPVGDPTDRVALTTALARLAPLDRAVVVLRFWEDRSVAQTAVDLDLSEAAVKNRSLRALRTLREHLAPLDCQPTHHGSTS